MRHNTRRSSKCQTRAIAAECQTRQKAPGDIGNTRAGAAGPRHRVFLAKARARSSAGVGGDGVAGRASPCYTTTHRLRSGRRCGRGVRTENARAYDGWPRCGEGLAVRET